MPAHQDTHQAHNGHRRSHQAGHGSFKSYITGFVLSLILTAIPFWVVMGDVFQNKLTAVSIILFLGLIQILVHMVYFLHMNTRSEGGWTIMALMFTVVIVAIAFSGSLWVMYHLNTNMMPWMNPESMRNMP